MKSHEGGHDDNGPAWISKVTFSKTGKTIYWKGKEFERYNSGCGNYIDTESGDEYWISGPKKDGKDRYQWAGEKVNIDPEIREEYWIIIRNKPERINDKFS